jgi:hypothetical protein
LAETFWLALTVRLRYCSGYALRQSSELVEDEDVHEIDKIAGLG